MGRRVTTVNRPLELNVVGSLKDRKTETDLILNTNRLEASARRHEINTSGEYKTELGYRVAIVCKRRWNGGQR